MDLVAPAGPVYQAGTLSGHPAVMAAGEATLMELTPQVYESLERCSRRLEKGLVGAGHTVARVASLLTVFFRGAAPGNFAEARTSDVGAFADLFQRLKTRGVLLPPSQFEAWFVSAQHDDRAIDATIEAASG